MKTFFLIVFSLFLFASPLVAQDWSPFIPNRINHYVRTWDWGVNWSDLGFVRIYTYIQDSVHNDTLFFNRKRYNPKMGDCAVSVFNDMVQSNGWNWPDLAPWTSLLRSGDSLKVDYQEKGRFVFLPGATVGQSWVANQWGLTVTCTAIELDTLLGLVDSVKIFTLSPGPFYSYPEDLANLSFRLSKHYGFWQFLPFESLSLEPTYYIGTMPPMMVLKGIQSTDGSILGLHSPDFTQSFAVQPGDILKYRVIEPSATIGSYQLAWHRDSVTSVATTATGIQVTSDRKTLHLHITYYSTTFIDSFFYADSVFIYNRFYNNNLIKNLFYFSTFKHTGDTSETAFATATGMYSRVDSLAQDTTFRAEITYGGFYYDSTQCAIQQTVTEKYVDTYDSRLGIVYHIQGDSWQTQTDETLEGYRLGGQIWGSIALPSAPTISRLRLSPNPTRDFLQVADFQPHSTAWQILAPDGRTLASGLSADGRIDVRDLPAGLYVLRMGQQTGRFVKE